MRLDGPTLDEIAAAALHLPLAQGDLRRRVSSEVWAVDATPQAAGMCEASVAPEIARALFRRSEVRGEHVRLDDAPLAVDVSDRLIARDADTDDLVCAMPWRVCSSYSFRQSAHINLQETRALRNAVRSLVKKKGSEDPQRKICFSDSRVCIGAVAKGRSSSCRLNTILRSLLSYLVLGRLTVCLIWIATGVNPADDPSRFVKLRAPSAPPQWARAFFPPVAAADAA